MFVASEWHKPDLSNTLILSASANLTAGKNGRCHHVLEKEIKGGREVNKKEKSQPSVYPPKLHLSKIVRSVKRTINHCRFLRFVGRFFLRSGGGMMGGNKHTKQSRIHLSRQDLQERKNKTEEAVSLRPRCVLWFSISRHGSAISDKSQPCSVWRRINLLQKAIPRTASARSSRSQNRLKKWLM